MPSLHPLHHRIATLERAATAHVPPSTEPITTLAELVRVSQRATARHTHPSRSSTAEEDALAKSDHLRLLDAYKSGMVLVLVRTFEEAYAQGPAAAERFLQTEGFSVKESSRVREAWIPAKPNTTAPQMTAGERR
ncbi:MAG: hypothetical protein HYZ50_12495 [Deltaproteobacteria bacterium]|nr:hypothetical protein [Deltaproteobacteria bacterium]